MKKLFAILLTLAALLGLAAFACAEEETAMPEAAAVFEGTWEAERATAELIWEEEGFRVYIVGRSSVTEATEWSYSCYWHAEDNSLVSMPFGMRTDLVYDEEGEIVSSEEIYDDGEAVFTLNEDGDLIWKDEKEDAGAGMVFVKSDAVPMPEEAAAFEGEWVCGRAQLEMYWEEEGFKIQITWGGSAWESAVWSYSGYYDAGTGAVVCVPFGSRTNFVYGEDGEVVSFEDIYDDGEATFTIDEDGHLLWNDAKEDAGAGMHFEKVVPDGTEG